jgi:hypothetical protein
MYRACCRPMLHGWFVREALYRIGLRHTVDCTERPSEIEELVKGAWFHQGRHLRTGKVYL